MGFLEYAEMFLLEKDPLKLKVILDAKQVYPSLKIRESIPEVRLPLPSIDKDAIDYLGFRFQNSDDSKVKVGRLFRAVAAHSSGRALQKIPRIIEKRSPHAEFVENVLRDVHLDAYISESIPERVPDLAYSYASSVACMKYLDKIYLPSTRIMTAILFRVFIGNPVQGLREEEIGHVEDVHGLIQEIKKNLSTKPDGEKIDLDQVRNNTNSLIKILSYHSPSVETPCFRHSDLAPQCSIYANDSASMGTKVEHIFREALDNRGIKLPDDGNVDSMWGRPVDDECLQAFSSTILQREKDDKILKRLRERIKETHFKSFEMPPEDYSVYLRVRQMIGGTTRRLLNNIIAASNFEFEDFQKMYGVLDLADAIQVIASKTPRNDIFQLDEIMKQSFSIVILLDVSRSMGISPQENRARAICIAEAAKDVIPDSNAWAFYAFSDRLYVIKDASESYSRRVRSRIGGVPFEGTTYMPDAMSAAAQFFRGSSEEQRIMFILSDGYPYGYPGIKEELDNLKRVYEGLGLIMIGIGFDTEKMKELFKYNASVYSQKDLVKEVGDIFLSASAEELL